MPDSSSNLTLHDLAAIVDGQLVSTRPGEEAARVKLGPIVTDSRQIECGDVFSALRGPNHDGADFTEEAFRRGASAAVIARAMPAENRWIVRVADAHEALWELAAWKRERFTGRMIAVTGSVGKTTTRQMIHTVLSSKLHGTTSPGNFNNQFGVPLSMLRLEPGQDYAVLELGANRSGEIATLASLCAPKIGVITSIGDAHLGGFGSRRAIAEAKAELLLALPRDGHAILGDDPWLRRVSSYCRAPITWVGESADCQVKSEHVESGQGRLRFVVDGQQLDVPVWGRHHLTAALIAVAMGRHMGVASPDIAAALSTFQSIPQRCEVIQIRGATIINDTYNASPVAMRAALTLLHDMETRGRRIVVCGDMAELGQEAAELHWELGQQTVSIGNASLLVACGQHARCVVAGARAAGMPRGRAIPCQQLDDALPHLGQAILPGDVVLVKGCRTMAMERVVEALRRYPQRRSA